MLACAPMIRCRLGVAGAVALAALIAAPARAQVDPSGSWRTLHTSHFRIHFRPAYRGVAALAANEAERAWGLLATELLPPRGTIDLTLSDDADIANGYATPVPSNRMTALLTPPGDEPSLQHYDSWLRIVIVHEMAHLFHLDRTRGLWRVLQGALGRAPGLFPNGYQPSWMVEGLATYYESRFTSGGRISGELHNEILAAQMTDSAVRSPWNAVYYTRWPAGFAPYAYGSRFLDWASTTVGDSLVPHLAEATAKQLIPFRVGRPYRRVSGRGIAADWDTASRVLPAAPSAARGELLVGGLRQAPGPRVSPDGRRIAYLHDDGRASPELRIVDVDGWQTVRAHSATGSVTYDWLGDTLVVAQLDFTTRRQIRSDLYSWLPDGTWRRDTWGRRLTEPRAGGDVLAVIEVTPAGHQPYVAWLPLADTAGTTWGAIVPSRDGRAVAATRHRDGHWQLVRWPANRPDSAAVLVASQDVITDPVWDASDSLYFVMPVAGFPQVHRWTAAGPVAVTDALLGARTPAPQAGGAFLYSALAGDGWALRRGTVGEPVAVTPPPPAPFEQAPVVAARETGYAWWPSAQPHYWLPFYVAAGRAGRFLGMSTSGSDALGRLSYVAHAGVSGSPVRALGGVAIAYDALGNPGLDASVSTDWDLLGTTSRGTVVSEHSYDAALGATWVTRRWRASASLRFAVEAEGSRFRTEPRVPISSACTGCSAEDQVGGSITARIARFVSAPLAVSTEDGFVWTSVYRRREEQGTKRWSGELQSRLATYVRLPRVGFAHPVIALRLAGGATHGSAPLVFSIGGVSSSVVDLGFGINLGTSRSFPVRGYEPSALRGRRAATATAELRWPVALPGQSLGHLPGGVDRVWLALFVDAGDTWDVGWTPHLSHLVGVGAEAVADLRVSYDLPLRARIGYARPQGTEGRARTAAHYFYAALGADF